VSLKDSLEPEEIGARGKIHIFVGLVTFIFVTCMADWTAGCMAALIAVSLAECGFELLTSALDYFRRR
jgi:hypothetical protein